MGQTVPGILQLIQTGWQSWKACRSFPTIGIYWKLFVVFICFTDRVGFKLMFLIHLIQEQGDLKLRVRTLESERAFQRVAAVQRTVGNVSSADLSSIFFSAHDNCTNNQFVPFRILYRFINYKENNLWNFWGLLSLGASKVKISKTREKIK